VTIPQMVKSGFGLNILGIVLVTVLTYALVIPVFDVVLNEIPAWATMVVK
jgi:sodium-dependent dicarboxylate transporter 2/3/5